MRLYTFSCRVQVSACLAIVWGCLCLGFFSEDVQAKSPKKDLEPTVLAGPAQRIAGIPDDILRKSGLEVVWPFADLMMHSDDRISEVYCHQGQLYIYSSKHYIISLNGSNGTINWTRVLPYAGLEHPPISFYGGLLTIMQGNVYMELRTSDGEIVRTLELPLDVTTAPVRNEELLFVGASDRRFYAVRLRDGVRLGRIICEKMPFGPAAIEDGRVFFTTLDNTIYAIEAENHRLLMNIPVGSRLAGVAVNAGQCFVPSADTSLYCLNAKTNNPIWRRLCGGALEELPALTDRYVYQPVAHKSLICLDRSDGKLLWELNEGEGFIAQNGTQSYVLTNRNELTVMDNATGKRVMSFFLTNIDLYATNTEDATLYLASDTGDVLTLRPTHIVAPPVVPVPVPAESPATPEENPVSP